MSLRLHDTLCVTAEEQRLGVPVRSEGRAPIRHGEPPALEYAPPAPALPWWQTPLGRWVAVWVAGLIIATLVLGACRLLALPDWGGAVDGLGYSVRHVLTGEL